MNKIWMTALVLLAVTQPVCAATGMALFTVNGVVEGSITVTIESIGGTTWGLGTSGVDTDIQSVSKYGVPPTGFTIARRATDWTLSSPVAVKVVKANLTSASFTLTAILLNAPPDGVVWKLNGAVLNDSTETVVTASGSYGSTATYTWDIVVADASTPGYIGNWVSLIATSN